MKLFIDIRGNKIVYISKIIASAHDNDNHVYNMSMMLDFFCNNDKKTILIIKTECNWLTSFADMEISESYQIALK